MIHHGKGSNASVAKPPPAEAHRVVKPSWSLRGNVDNVCKKRMSTVASSTIPKCLYTKNCSPTEPAPTKISQACLLVRLGITPLPPYLSVFGIAASLLICVQCHPYLPAQLYATPLPPCLDNEYVELPTAWASSSERSDYLTPAFLCTCVHHFFIPPLPRIKALGSKLCKTQQQLNIHRL